MALPGVKGLRLWSHDWHISFNPDPVKQVVEAAFSREGLCVDLPPMLLHSLFHPAFLARVVTWLGHVAPIFMVHEDGDSKSKPGDGKYRAC